MMLDMSSLLSELNKISDDKVDSPPEWTEDLTVFAMYLILEDLGWDLLDEAKKGKKLITPGRAKELGVGMGEFLVPPKPVFDAPFPETLDFWWAGVAKVIQDGEMFDAKGRPNYRAVYTYWKDEINKKYGFRPGATKELSMTKQLKKMTSSAASALSRKRRGMKVDPVELTKAARALGKASAAARRRRKKEMEFDAA